MTNMQSAAEVIIAIKRDVHAHAVKPPDLAPARTASRVYLVVLAPTHARLIIIACMHV